MAAAVTAVAAGDGRRTGISSAIPAAVAAIVAEDGMESGNSSAGAAATSAAAAGDNLASGLEFAMTAADKFFMENTPAVAAEDGAKNADPKPEGKNGYREARQDS